MSTGRIFEATAPGKIILFGEHAVVYGRPALAAPVTHLRARALIELANGSGVRLVAPDLGRDTMLATARADNPLAATVRLVEQHAGLAVPPGAIVTVTSAIPIASGLGSGAAIAVAVIRALSACLGLGLTREQVSALAYEVERLHHGTPSGIDNTVIACEQPVYFVRRQPANLIEPFSPARPLRLVIGDTGVRSATKHVVNDVRVHWEAERQEYETIFDACGRLAEAGREALARGELAAVGRLMNENHEWLIRMGVSSAGLDRLVTAALAAGALGAKLGGSGRGGNMISLGDDESEEGVCDALRVAGAARTYRSNVG